LISAAEAASSVGKHQIVITYAYPPGERKDAFFPIVSSDRHILGYCYTLAPGKSEKRIVERDAVDLFACEKEFVYDPLPRLQVKVKSEIFYERVTAGVCVKSEALVSVGGLSRYVARTAFVTGKNAFFDDEQVVDPLFEQGQRARKPGWSCPDDHGVIMSLESDPAVGGRLAHFIGDLCHKFKIGVKPIDAEQFVLCQPADVRRLFGVERSGIRRAPEAVHRQVKERVIVFHPVDQLANDDLCTEFLSDLAHERLLGRLARLKFSAGKLPSAFELTVTARRGEYFRFVFERIADHRCGNSDCFHVCSVFLTPGREHNILCT